MFGLQMLWDRFRSWIYDRWIVSFTAIWYRLVLEALPSEAWLLGTALIRNADIIRKKKLVIHGVDYDRSYVMTCRKEISAAGLDDYIQVVHESIYSYRPLASKRGDSPYDAVYFSGSFMILPDKSSALNRVLSMLRDRKNGRIYFTQTFELKKNHFLEWLKPRLSFWTSIDFGSVTYEHEFDAVLESCHVTISRQETIPDGKEVPGKRRSVLIEGHGQI